jgi:hypothetical protein
LQEGADLLFRIGPLHDSSMQARILAPHRFRSRQALPICRPRHAATSRRSRAASVPGL